MTFEFTTNLPEHLDPGERPVRVTCDYSERERATFDYPGCPATLEVESAVDGNGRDWSEQVDFEAEAWEALEERTAKL